jgi:hypothetical protein
VDGAQRLLRIPIEASTLRSADVIEVEEEPVPTETGRLLDEFSMWFGRRGDTLIAGSYRHGARNGAELEAINVRTGEARRVAPSRQDDNAPSFAPDGQMAVFVTSRWDTLTSRADLALLDWRTGAVSPLVQSPEVEFGGRWSPDGSRIAFGRRHYTSERASELCWITVDRSVERCLAPEPGIEAPTPLAWLDNDELIVEGEASDGSDRLLARVHLGTGALRILHRNPTPYSVSPDGRFAIVHGFAPDGRTHESVVFATDRPEQVVPVRWQGRSVTTTPVQVAWSLPTASGAMLEAVRIEAPEDAVPLDALVRLTAVASDARGTVRRPGTLQWRSLDSTIARVAPTGELLPRATGEVDIVASAGGWRADTVRLRITDRAFDTPVLSETWDGLDSTRWLDFGDPTPVARGGTLRPNGDFHLISGVMTWETIDARAGIGFEVRARIPVTEPQWQSMTALLTPFAPTDALRAWSGRRQGTEIPSYRAVAAARQCGVAVPRGEGGDGMRRGQLVAGTANEPIKTLDPRVSDGSWHTFRVQLFRDGRCGLAIDGRVVRISRERVPLDQPFRVYLAGQTVGTDVRVGPLEVWRGERLDVPWFAGDSAGRAGEGAATR